MKNTMIPRAITQKLIAIIVLENLGGEISVTIISRIPTPTSNPDTAFPPNWLAQVFLLVIGNVPRLGLSCRDSRPVIEAQDYGLKRV
jgi:hypothetical protein